MKHLNRTLKYLAVFSEPVVPEDDMGPAHSLSYAEEGAESEARERARKRRTKEDGTGRGKGLPDARRRNRNPSKRLSKSGYDRGTEIARLKTVGWGVNKEGPLWMPVVPPGYELTQTQSFHAEHGFSTRKEVWDWVIDTVSRNQ